MFLSGKMLSYLLLGLCAFSIDPVESQSNPNLSLVNHRTMGPFKIPAADDDTTSRDAQIALTREGFIYGPSPLTNVSFSQPGH